MTATAHEHLLLHFTSNGLFAPGGRELLVIERGEGPYVYDTSGRRLLDAMSGIACTQLGHGDPYAAELAEAAREQMAKLAFNTVWSMAHPAAIELSDVLAGLAPEGIDKVFFTSGGADSVEAAWKLVRQYHVMNGEPQRTKAIARRSAYHGVTLGALSFTGIPAFKEPFGRPAVPTRHVSPTNAFRSDESEGELCQRLLDEVEEVILAEGPETVAMLIAEPVQNGGGCFTPPAGYWPGLREIADRHGLLLVADEVISGMGRIGEWFAVAKYGATPDLITIAKGLTSAYAPMGAVMVSERVAAPFYEEGRTLLHGITFAGHPLCAAIALKNLEIFRRDGILEGVRARAPYLHAALERLRELAIVGDVRGDGFFWAIELVKDEQDGRFEPDEVAFLVKRHLPAAFLERGLIARADDRGDPVVQIAPPLICEEPVLDEIVATIGAVLEETGKRMLTGATSGSVSG